MTGLTMIEHILSRVEFFEGHRHGNLLKLLGLRDLTLFKEFQCTKNRRELLHILELFPSKLIDILTFFSTNPTSNSTHIVILCNGFISS